MRCLVTETQDCCPPVFCPCGSDFFAADQKRVSLRHCYGYVSSIVDVTAYSPHITGNQPEATMTTNDLKEGSLVTIHEAANLLRIRPSNGQKMAARRPVGARQAGKKNPAEKKRFREVCWQKARKASARANSKSNRSCYQIDALAQATLSGSPCREAMQLDDMLRSDRQALGEIRGELVTRRVDELHPHSSYARCHLSVSPSQLSTLAELGDLAFRDPIIITRDGTVLDGYGRLKLAQLKGLAHSNVSNTN